MSKIKNIKISVFKIYIYIYRLYIYRMSDNYEFMNSNEDQDATDYSPYVDKQYNNYINDINNGVYTNNSLTLVNFDLGQIYNPQKFTETSELFAVLPIAVVAGFSNGTAVVAPAASSQALCTIKIRFSEPYTSGRRSRKWPLYRAMPTFH
jgi:hypothetical protein